MDVNGGKQTPKINKLGALLGSAVQKAAH